MICKQFNNIIKIINLTTITMQKSSNLKKARLALKLTQSEIAEVLGITRKEYSNIEKYTPNEMFRDILSSGIKETLVTRFDINLQYVYGYEDTMFHNSHTSYGRVLDRILAIIEHKGMSIGAFAEGLDIDPTDRMRFIADVSAGRDPGTGFTGAILACYPDVNRTFIRKGYGAILKE
jgi:DNA-binding XRE family transcriptional regulator